MRNSLPKAHAFFVVCGILLSGCTLAPVPKDPVYRDGLTGLYNQPASSVPENVPHKIVEPVALVVSENAEEYLVFVKGLQDRANSWKMPSATDRYVGEMAPEYLVDYWVDAVKRKYSNVELVEDLRTAQQKNMRTTLVLDPQITLGKLSGQTNHILLNAIVFNSEMKPVSRIQGYGRSTIPYPFWDINFRPAAIQALNEFDAKLKSIDR